MSFVRMTFWEDVARGYGGSAWPKKYGMNWFIPALVRRSPVSDGGISDDERTRVWPRSSKKRRNLSRISGPCTRVSLRGRTRGSVELGPDLGLLLRHALAPLLEDLPYQLPDVLEGVLELPPHVGGSHPLGLLAHPPGREDRRRDARAQAEGHPERASHGLGLLLADPLDRARRAGGERRELDQRVRDGLLHHRRDALDR